MKSIFFKNTNEKRTTVSGVWTIFKPQHCIIDKQEAQRRTIILHCKYIIKHNSNGKVRKLRRDLLDSSY